MAEALSQRALFDTPPGMPPGGVLALKSIDCLGTDEGGVEIAAERVAAKAERAAKIGHARVKYKEASGILTKTTGFMDAYDYSLNPYSGCSFGCTYCYAAFFTRDKGKMDNWGYWVEVKENALSLLQKKRGRLDDKVIYMSSVTDPYQPIERKTMLTRRLLEEFAEHHKVRLVVQTRSPTVTRDIPLFQQIGRVQVNMTVTTDDEGIRKVFEPFCPSNAKRLEAIKEVNDAGVQSCITMTPLLPVSDSVRFAESLKDTGVERFIIQQFHTAKGKFVAGTRESAMEIFRKYDWSDSKYKEVLGSIREAIPNIGIGKDGFAPPL